MDKIETVIRNTTEASQLKTDWSQVWSARYPVLLDYRTQVDTHRFAENIRGLLDALEEEYGYGLTDAMLVLKDILYREYLDERAKNRGKTGEQRLSDEETEQV